MTLDFGIAPMYNAGRALAPFFYEVAMKKRDKDDKGKGKGGKKPC
jgi:hypothetical protein